MGDNAAYVYVWNIQDVVCLYHVVGGLYIEKKKLPPARDGYVAVFIGGRDYKLNQQGRFFGSLNTSCTSFICASVMPSGSEPIARAHM